MTTTHVSPGTALPNTRNLPRSRTPVRPAPDPSGSHGERLASFLGWFSLGLGAAAVAAPGALARMIGARGDRADRTVLQLVGLQEIACGIGVLATRRPAGWMWARVAGDVAHFTMLSRAMASGPPDPGRMAAATASIAGIAALDAYNAVQLSRRPESAGHAIAGPIEVHQSITISRPAAELYRFWRDFGNLPRIMAHLESVEVRDDRRSHWVANAPAGMTVAWDAEITEDRPDQLIAWRSVGGHVENDGLVRFVPAPGGRGTEVHVEIRYEPPGGVLGHWFAKLFGESPDQQAYDGLRHFKQVMETGEVVRSEGGNDGTRVPQHPGQPSGSGRGR